MRVLCYAQNLIGVGHFVRMLAIARGLAAAGHEVHLVEGGRAVPHRTGPFDPSLVTLPRLVRLGGRLVAEEPGGSVVDVLAQRARRLAEAVERIRPETLLVDHYPFGRWELDREIQDAIVAARRAHAGVRVVCSVRDNLRSNYRSAERDAHELGVLARLGAFFDEMLIHTDPRFARLGDAFGRVREIALPVRYTGFVVDRQAVPSKSTVPREPYAVLSCGGSTTNLGFLLAAIEAFRRVRARSAWTAMPLFVFPGPVDAAGAAALRAAIAHEPFALFDFRPDFPAWLAGSTLSISRAGYNTCAQILDLGIRSVLVPNPENADQAPRARRLAELGVATVAEGDPPEADTLAAAIMTALARPPGRHALDLDGVAATCTMLERPHPGAGRSGRLSEGDARALFESASFAALRAQLPGADLSRAVYLDRGIHVTAYRVGTWVIRVPRTPTARRLIPRQTRFYQVLAGWGLPVPRDAGISRDAAGEVVAGFYRYVAGEPATASRRSPALARDLGAFLTALHAVPPAFLRDVCEMSHDVWTDRFRGYWERCRPHLPAAERGWLEEVIARFLASGETTSARQVPIHGDLAEAHVLLDADARLAGVVDPSGPRIADPALDFGTLAERFGWAFAGLVLAAYGGPADPDLGRRTAFLASIRPLATIEAGLRHRSDERFQLGLRRLAERMADARHEPR